MVTRISGTERFDESITDIWSRLSDLSFIADAIPGLSSVTEISCNRLSCKVKPALSFLTGSLSTTITIQERTEPYNLIILIYSKGIGSEATVKTVFDLVDDGDCTRVFWTGTIEELGGLLKPISTAIVEASANKVIASAWDGFRSQLSLQG
jgi:carbon monoxide dehydrogenase subunit G